MNDDLISRKEASIAFVEKGQRSHRYKLGELWELNGEEIRDVLNNLPSAKLEQKTSVQQKENNAIKKYQKILQIAIDVISECEYSLTKVSNNNRVSDAIDKWNDISDEVYELLCFNNDD